MLRASDNHVEREPPRRHPSRLLPDWNLQPTPELWRTNQITTGNDIRKAEPCQRPTGANEDPFDDFKIACMGTVRPV